MTQPDQSVPSFTVATALAKWTGAERRSFRIDTGTPIQAADGGTLPSSNPMPFTVGPCRDGALYERVADFTFDTTVPQTEEWHDKPFDRCRKIRIRMLFDGGYAPEWLTVELKCTTHPVEASSVNLAAVPFLLFAFILCRRLCSPQIANGAREHVALM
jgi:hypothetical protein